MHAVPLPSYFRKRLVYMSPVISVPQLSPVTFSLFALSISADKIMKVDWIINITDVTLHSRCLVYLNNNRSAGIVQCNLEKLVARS